MSDVILAIDPGTDESAYVVLDGHLLAQHGIVPNDEMLCIIADVYGNEEADVMVIEKPEGRGMPVGQSTLDTAFAAGQFWETWRGNKGTLFRRQVKMCLCGNMNAKDKNVDCVVANRFGGEDKRRAKGTKKHKGPLYGIHDDEWAALAVALTWQETKGERNER